MTLPLSLSHYFVRLWPLLGTIIYFFLNQGPNVVHNEMGDVTVGSDLVTTSKNQLQTGLSQTDVGLMRVITIR